MKKNFNANIPSTCISSEKKAYIDKINHAMNRCADISTLDLILKILEKSEK